ncbi:hypothetical protein [Kocuria kalidii]|uniref:hypothetical protein n=1 Tax=Kocuria kalidii TaxID=3376283 RepID=UPI00378C1D81
MAHTEETKRLIGQKVKARYAADPEYRAKVASRSREVRVAEREELVRLRQENAELRAEVERLRTRDGR